MSSRELPALPRAAPASGLAPWKVAIVAWGAITIAPLALVLLALLAALTIPLVPLWMALFRAWGEPAPVASSSGPPRLAHGPLMRHAAAGAGA